MKKTPWHTQYERAERAEAEHQQMLERLIELRQHIQLPKFHDDTTIQVADIHRWIDYITERYAKETT